MSKKPLVCLVLTLLIALAQPPAGLAATGPTDEEVAQPAVARSAPDFSCAGVSEIPQVECEALVTLYNTTNRAGWTVNRGWLTTNTLDYWIGISYAGGHVTELNPGVR